MENFSLSAYESLRKELQDYKQDALRYRLIRDNNLSITRERDTTWTRENGSKFICSWSIRGDNVGYLLAEDSLDKMIDAVSVEIN
jgi:hypothetical protein